MNYKLLDDEVVLMQSDVKIQNCCGEAHVSLSNYNLIIDVKYKLLFEDDRNVNFVFPLTDIKMFNGVPHINIKDKTAEIYLKQHELICEFFDKKKLNQFIDHINKLLTGETGFERGLKKTKEAIVNTVGQETIEKTGTIIKEGVLDRLAGLFGVKK